MAELTKEARYLALYLLKKQVATAEAELKADYETGDAKLRPGERRAVYIALPDGTEYDLGALTRTKPKSDYKVTDAKALERWIHDTHPDIVETVEVKTIPEWFVSGLLTAAKARGAAVTEDGEEIPGIELTTGTSYVAPKPATEALDTFRELMALGEFQWGNVLELEA